MTPLSLSHIHTHHIVGGVRVVLAIKAKMYSTSLWIRIAIVMTWQGHAFCNTDPLWRESPHKGPVMQSFDPSFIVNLNKLLNKQMRWQWFGTDVKVIERLLEIMVARSTLHKYISHSSQHCVCWWLATVRCQGICRHSDVDVLVLKTCECWNVNSLAPGEYCKNLKSIIFKHTIQNITLATP